jgi:peptidoglycan/LPS O-acetylase OafA/YrhL
MYILHFMIAWYGVEYLHHWLAATGRPILLLGMYYLLTLLLAFGAALVSEKVIEKPGIEAGRRVIQKMGKAGVGHA